MWRHGTVGAAESARRNLISAALLAVGTGGVGILINLRIASRCKFAIKSLGTEQATRHQRQGSSVDSRRLSEHQRLEALAHANVEHAQIDRESDRGDPERGQQGPAQPAPQPPDRTALGCSLVAFIVILGSFFLIPGIAQDPEELIGLRELWTALETSRIVDAYQTTVIPGFFSIFDLFIPDSIQVWFQGTPA